MIEKIWYLFADGADPYENLALEEYLLFSVLPDEVILYLWQNEKTVVIGKNQNCYAECKIAELEADGGRIARRLSGGGAVFHDKGNLNFTFLTRAESYDVNRQLEVIIRAVNSFGIAAKKTGRNDIETKDAKFSGNAFYKSGDFCYHHGTLLIDADMEKLSLYLNVSAQKLKSKSVSSVKARVVNLKSLNDGITVEKMKSALIKAFAEVYNSTPKTLRADRISSEKIKALTKKYSSWEFVFGKNISFSNTIEARFDWGGIELQLDVKGGKIVAAKVYSDAMDYEFTEKIPAVLIGKKYSNAEISQAISALIPTSIDSNQMKNDICKCLLSISESNVMEEN